MTFIQSYKILSLIQNIDFCYFNLINNNNLVNFKCLLKLQTRKGNANGFYKIYFRIPLSLIQARTRVSRNKIE